MARDKDQVLIYSKAELEHLKAVFAENDELIYAIRKVLLQMPMSAEEWALVRSQVNPAVHALIKKRVFPDLDSEVPLGQLGDLYQTLTKDLATTNVADMAPLFQAKKLEKQYLDQQFAILLGNEVEEVIKLDELKEITDDALSNYVNTTARNFLLGFVDPMLVLLQNLAGTKEETPEQQAERLTRNSNK